MVWKTPGLVAGDAWSKELEGSRDLIGDWVGKKCGNYNTKTNKCGGQVPDPIHLQATGEGGIAAFSSHSCRVITCLAFVLIVFARSSFQFS